MKKFLKAILFSSLFIVATTVSAFASTGNVSVSFTDADGNAITELAVGESATMTATLVRESGGNIMGWDFFYELEGLTLTSTDSNWVESDVRFGYFDSNATKATVSVTATVTATTAGVASITSVQDSSYYLDDTGMDYYDFAFTGNTLTVTAPAPDKTDVVVAPVASYDKSDAFEKDGAEYYHAAFKKEITVTADNNAVAGLKLEADKEVDVMFDTVVKDGTVNVAINILNVPADATLGTITITPIAE